MYDSQILNFTLPENERKKIENFALLNQKNREIFYGNGEEGNRQYCNVLEKEKNIDEKIVNLCLKIQKDICNKLNLNEFKQDESYGIFLGVNNPGAFIPKHKDNSEWKFKHLRINCMISKPTSGGIPHINDVPLDVDESQFWFIVVDEQEHSSSVVLGKKDRIVLSCGIFITENVFNEKIYILMK
jgi:hypothetical protein